MSNDFKALYRRAVKATEPIADPFGRTAWATTGVKASRIGHRQPHHRHAVRVVLLDRSDGLHQVVRQGQ